MSDIFDTEDQSGNSALEALVGEGKKFADPEALAKGKVAADEHIQTIEQENAELKAKLDAKGDSEFSFADVVEAVKKAQTTSEEQGTQTLSEEDFIEIARKVYTGENEAATKASNRRKGNELVLQMVDGNVDAAKQLVAERAAKLGMTTSKLAELSESSPDAFATLVKGESTASSGSTSQLPSHNTQTVNGDQPVMERNGFKTKAWFDAKRNEVGRVAYLNDQELQRELTRSMNGLGEDFNN